MRRRPSSWFALLCAFFLLFAQGAAFAHWIEHVGGDTRATVSSSIEKDAHGKPAGADDHCLSCLAYAGIVAAPPLDSALASDPVDVSVFSDGGHAAHPRAQFLRPYGARAPPIRL